MGEVCSVFALKSKRLTYQQNALIALPWLDVIVYLDIKTDDNGER